MNVVEYRIQVKIRGRWEDVHPSAGGVPYQWSTRVFAERMLRMSYPDQLARGEARVCEVVIGTVRG